MSKLSIGLGAIVAVAGAGAIYVQQRSLADLRGELGQLREEMRVAAKQAAVNEARKKESAGAASAEASAAGKPTAETGEVAKLRGDVAELKKSAQEFGKIVQAAQAKAAESSIPTNLVPVAEWKNGGRDSAGAALKTVLWAATGGEVEVLAQGLNFTATARAKADAWFNELSEATKAQYGSPEKVIALMIAKDAAAVSGMQVIGQREITPDDVGIRVRLGTEQGQTKDDSFLLHRSPTQGWQLVLSDAVVDKFAKQLKQAGAK